MIAIFWTQFTCNFVNIPVGELYLPVEQRRMGELTERPRKDRHGFGVVPAPPSITGIRGIVTGSNPGSVLRQGLHTPRELAFP